MLYNESKHNILAYQGKAKKPNISVVLPIQGYPKEKLKKGRRRKEGRKKQRKKMNPKFMLMWMCQGLLVDQLHQSRMTTKIEIFCC
jgi:hypothetical protein